MGNIRKKPKSSKTPSESKEVKQKENPDSFMHMNISWHFKQMEFNTKSNWNWNDVFKINQNNAIFKKLCSYETMKLSEVQNSKNHRIDKSDLNKIARDELEKKKLNDIETLHSFHLNATTRFYCIPYGNIMALLWYDEYHSQKNQKKSVCLSPR